MASTSLFGQSSAASLSGTVLDEQEGVVSSARVTLRDPGKGVSREMTTDGNGAFVFSQVPPSTYELTVEQPGFARVRFTDIAINANDQRSLRLKFKVAARDEVMIVTSEAPIVRENPSVATSVDRSFIANQPWALVPDSDQSLARRCPCAFHSSRSRPVFRQRTAQRNELFHGRRRGREFRSSVRDNAV